MRRWLYDASDPGVLTELDLELSPGQEFEAPDSWQPEPTPHPVYKPIADIKSAPAQAPQE